MEKTLVIGIGNISRGDDGLGWAFANRLIDDERFDVQYRYQLQVEDAELISGYKEVWFIDASHTGYHSGFDCKKVEPESKYSYTTHELHPSSVVYLCNDLYGRSPDTYLLGISGDEWELGHQMSEAARERLESAFNYFLETIAQEVKAEVM